MKATPNGVKHKRFLPKITGFSNLHQSVPAVIPSNFTESL